MPIQVVPQQGRTEAFGNLFSGAMSGIVQGMLAKRQMAQDDAMKIWQMAQYDPLILQTAEATTAFQKAGWPLPKFAQTDISSFLGEQTGGLGVTGFERDPLTGRVKSVRYGQPPSPKMLRGRDYYHQWNPQTGQWEASSVQAPQGNILNEYLAETMGTGITLNEWLRQRHTRMPAPQPAPVPPPAAAPALTPPPIPTPTGIGAKADALVAPPWQALADAWLTPDTFTGAIEAPSPAPRMSDGLANAIKTGGYVPTFRGFGPPSDVTRTPRSIAKAPAPAPAAPTTGGYKLEDYGMPATQEEFERNVRELAKSDRQKAKAYYDRWASKWQ